MFIFVDLFLRADKNLVKRQTFLSDEKNHCQSNFHCVWHKHTARPSLYFKPIFYLHYLNHFNQFFSMLLKFSQISVRNEFLI